MSTPIDSVIAQLQEVGIVPPEKLAEFIPPTATPTDPKAWTAQLVERGLLTQFQATQTALGKAKSLVIGSYEMVDRLAGGGGLLFKARHRRMKRMVMIKPLAPSLMKAVGPRVLADVEVVGRLQHPNVVAVQDVDEVGGAHFLVAEFVEATDLATLVQQKGKLQIATACSYASQAAAGLAKAQSQGVVHRDVKAEYLFVDSSGVVKVLGFGLTANEGESAADVAALGRTLYRLLVGTDAPSGAAPLPLLRTVRPDAPAAVEAYLARMTAENAAERPTMAEVAAALASPDSLPQPAGEATSDDAFPELFAAAEEEIAPAVKVNATPELIVSSPISSIAISASMDDAPAIVVAPVEIEPEVPAFVIQTKTAPSPAAASKRPAVTSPVMSIGPIATSDEVEESPPAVIPLESDSSEGIETLAVATNEAAGDSLGFSVKPSQSISASATKAAGRKPAARGKKSSLPFKIDPKYLQPKYLIGGGAGIIVVLSLLLGLVISGQKREEPVPVRALKVIPKPTPKPVPTNAFQLPSSDSLNSVRPANGPSR